MSSIRNTVVVALLQVGVIVAAVLAAGVCHRVWLSRGWVSPILVMLFYNYGVAGLLIPLTWAAGAVALQIRPGVSEDVRILMFWLGVLILIVLVVLAVYADVSPWLVYLRNTGNPDDTGP
ncbi:MAG TPA: hypothetical protein VH280_16370 [Verrucomicrobiae bacterium]|jgi:hypothetical protein|nr:hypothetical protein [Verrucomicrobiae bacterium]